jgi:plasmid stabilization system protein ParE
MAAKPLEIHPSALAEFKSALSWYLERNETAADKFVAELDRAIEIAGRDTPTLASRRPWHSEVRPACEFPFAIFSREKQAVQVLAIAHGHRRPGYWKDRL